jgi:hypothetical protein
MIWNAPVFDLKDLVIVGLGGIVVGLLAVALRQVNVHVPEQQTQPTSGIGVLIGWLLLIGAIGFAAYLLVPMFR